MDPNDFFAAIEVIAYSLAGGFIFYVFGSLISPDKKKKTKKEEPKKISVLDKNRKF